MISAVAVTVLLRERGKNRRRLGLLNPGGRGFYSCVVVNLQRRLIIYHELKTKTQIKLIAMLEYIEQRDRDFTARCRELRKGLRPGERVTRRELVERAIGGGAPCYYLTFDYAYRMLRDYRRGRLPPRYNRLKTQMLQELARKTDSYKQSTGCTADTEALSVVLARGAASRFFISPDYAIRLLGSFTANRL